PGGDQGGDDRAGGRSRDVHELIALRLGDGNRADEPNPLDAAALEYRVALQRVIWHASLPFVVCLTSPAAMLAAHHAGIPLKNASGFSRLPGGPSVLDASPPRGYSATSA